METDRTRKPLTEGSPMRAEDSPSRAEGYPSRARTFGDAAEAPHHRKWWLVPLWLVIMAGAAWLTFTVLQHREILQAQIPAAQHAIAALGERMGQAEAGLRQWVSRQDAVQESLATLEKQVQSQIAAGKRHASSLVAQLRASLRADLEARTVPMAARLDKLEVADRDGLTRLARLESELETARQQLEGRIVAAEHNQYQDKQLMGERMSGLDRGLQDNRSALQKFEQGLAVSRVDFEVSKGHSHQVVEGVTVNVTKTDVARRRVNGWMWIMPDRKTLWLRDQGVMRPVIFYSEADGKRREVVFTRVTRDAAIGYALIPAEGTGAQASLASAASTSSAP